MNIKLDSLTVLGAVFSYFMEHKTLKTNMTFQEIHKALPEMNFDTLKAMVEYLAGHGYVTFEHHPMFQDICITSKGIDYYIENFK